MHAGDGYDDAAWAKLARRGRVLRAKHGQRDEKLGTLRAMGRENSVRAAREYAAWMVASLKLEDALLREVERAQRRARRGKVSEKKKEAYHDAVRARDGERDVREEIAVRVSRLTDGDALAFLAANEDRDVQRARESIRFRFALLNALLAHPSFHRFKTGVAAFAEDEDFPVGRIRVLDWIARNKVKEARAVAERCLGAGAAAIRRAAVRALRGIDDPRAVPALIRALNGAKGQFAHETEALLRWFTGQKFTGILAGEQYSRWWAQHGEAWLANESGRRHRDRLKQIEFRAEFYGIQTRSTRIVFVLDRSGSMKEPVPRYGPVSGARKDDAVPGKNKMEVAKNKLARTVRSLNPDVKFSIVFFDAVVEDWTKPPLLKLATPEHKHQAIQWFDPIGPNSSTSLFAALNRALDYAKTLEDRRGPGRRRAGPGRGGSRTGASATTADPDGADTVFLLSDGHPTEGDGIMTAERVNEEVGRFLDKNRTYRLVVHTIGIGPNHSVKLMKRLAEATGGTYRAVGMPRRKK